MKEYKLKQYYPSLPSDWKDVEIIVVVERGYHYGLHPSINNKSVIYFGKEEIENSPEFWEEIKEKEYEILSFINPDSKYIFDKGKNGMFGQFGIWNEEHLLTNSPCEIYSVKRLSDGEIFTIGDRIAINSSWEEGEPCIIDKFTISDKDTVKINIKQGDMGSTYGNFEKFYKVVKKPLLTTEDGVDLFEGDKYYTVFTESKQGYDIYKVNGSFKLDNGNYVHKGIKYFSTRKVAEEYIVREHPVLNMNDIHILIAPHLHFNVVEAYHKMEEKTREKLGFK